MNVMEPLSADMMHQIRTLRQIQKVSAQTLANRITALGFTVSREMIANLEGGRKQTVPFDFVVRAAEALGSTLPELLAGPVKCPTCSGNPPVGFTCNTCGSKDG